MLSADVILRITKIAGCIFPKFPICVEFCKDSFNKDNGMIMSIEYNKQILQDIFMELMLNLYPHFYIKVANSYNIDNGVKKGFDFTIKDIK